MKMKTRIIGLAVLLFGLSVSLWTACDKIADDEMLLGPEKIAPKPLEEDAPIDSTLQYIVLEDFTGVQCPNCPKAAAEAHVLQKQYGNQLILIELHPEKAGVAEPYEGEADLRSAEAQTYFDYWKGTSLPAGLVNRQTTQMVGYKNWSGAVQEISAQKPVATVNKVSAKLDGQTLSVEASGFFHADYAASGNINLIMMVLEDGFSGHQAGTEQSDYPHNHVLRATVGDVWGEQIDVKPNAGARFTLAKSIKVDAAWNTDNLSVVCLLTDADTRAILNAAKVKVKK